MNEFPQTIKILIDNSIDVKVVKRNGEYVFAIGGFYKSDFLYLKYLRTDLGIDVFDGWDRYDKIGEVHGLGEICAIHIQWWEKSKSRFDGWAYTDSNWVTLLINAGLLTVETKEIKEYRLKH